MNHVLTKEAMQRAQAEFACALEDSVPPDQMFRLELFSDEEEEFIQREVDRMLCQPKLPNAGARERLWLKKLKKFAYDESLVIVIKTAAGRYAAALESLLPRQEFIRNPLRTRTKRMDDESNDEEPESGKGSKWMALPGCYYVCKPVSKKTNQSLFDAAQELQRNSGKDLDKKWLAEFLLAGEPEAVSNFQMKCLYLLRGADGNVIRLVRLVNIKGELSSGKETGGMDILPAEEFSSAEKFRAWCKSKGNFDWGVGNGAGNLELQMLHSDVSNNAAYKVARLIEYCGWHPLPGNSHGIWIGDDCAFLSHGGILLPDEDGVIHHDGEIYVLARKGREADFMHGRPKLRPNATLDGSEPWLKAMESVKQVELDKSGWEPASLILPGLAGFFRETGRRFNDTVGDLGGWLALGSMLGYAAGPEYFEQWQNFPSIFIPGQMGSGKTSFTNWLMGIPGYEPTKGLTLSKGSRVTPVGLCQQLENHSCLPVWFDEYRQYEIADEKVSIIRDAYDRQLAGKWTPDGVQRVIRTTPIVSGETDTSDAATRSRYTHVQISAARRRANHLKWMRNNRPYFYLFWRHLMVNRPEFVKIAMRQVENWMDDADTQSIPDRSRQTYSLTYAAFTAASILFNSHSSAEMTAFRKFIIDRVRLAADDVSNDVNINIFIRDLITAFIAGEIPPDLFRTEKVTLQHPPGKPNQGLWDSYILYFDPKSVIAALQLYLRKRGQQMTLNYNDLRDQLSKTEAWDNTDHLRQRFGKPGERRHGNAWGIIVDRHPLGLQNISDEKYQASLSTKPLDLGAIGPVFQNADPRKGDLFSIIAGVERFEAQENQEDKQ